MKIVLSTIGKFHTFDLARQLHSHGALGAVFTAYPRFKLRGEDLPAELIHTFPWVRAPLLALRYRRYLGYRINRAWEYVDRTCLDRYVRNNLPPCEVFVGLSGSALRSGRAARARGAKYVCDRGSSHIRVQDRQLREEHDRWGLEFDGIDPRVIDLEEREYAESDCITVPSSFALRSFVDSGVASNKLRRLPYGVDLSRFEPDGRPDRDRFDVLFVGGMSLRKGIPYLIQAYRALAHAGKSLTLVGSVSPELIRHLRRRGVWEDDVRVLGSLPHAEIKRIMSRSHVVVLPSVEDGFGLVLAEAMACGCPVIGSRNTGTEDLLSADGCEGFVVPVRDSDAIARRLQQMADDPSLRAWMSGAAINRVRQLGGWRDYGSEALATYRALLA